MLKVYTTADMRFTVQRGENGSYILYATLFAWPADGKITLTSLAAGTATIAGQVEHVSLPGSPQRVQFTRDASGLHVTLPPWKPSDFANVLRITGFKAP